MAKSTSLTLFALVCICGHLYAVDPESVSTPVMVRLIDCMEADSTPPIQRNEYIGTEMRRVLMAPFTSLSSLCPADDDGYIHISVQKDLPPLEVNSLGLRLCYAYYEGPISLYAKQRKDYCFVSADALKKGDEIKLKPPGLPMPQVRIYARQVLPQTQSLVSKEVEIPENGRLDFAIALQRDWRIPRGAGAVFQIRIFENGKAATVFEETLQRSMYHEEPQWQERSVSLERYAGHSVRFAFNAEPVTGIDDPDAQFAYPLWANPILQGTKSGGGSNPPNIILIGLDTLRADRLGCYGYPRLTSPNIDAFAKKGILFEQAIASAPWTTPSFASIFTGLHPSRHQAGLFSKGFALNSQFVTLAEQARVTNRLTAAFTEGVCVRSQFGFSQGFDQYSDGVTPDKQKSGTAEKTMRDALAWLDSYGRLPFFLFVHSYECHMPYMAPSPWGLMFTASDCTDRAEEGAEWAVTDEEKRYVSDCYDGEIAYTDYWVGCFLDELKARQLLDNTIVVIFADHGEEFWEHDGIGHVTTLYDEVLHVPLIVYIPWVMSVPMRVKEQVAVADLFATLHDLLNLPLAEGLDSYSLLPLFMPNEDRPYARRFVASEMYYYEFDCLDALNFPFEWLKRSLRYPNFKYIISNKPNNLAEGTSLQLKQIPDEFLYHLSVDPDEQKDVHEERADTTVRLKGELLEFLGGTNPLQDVSDALPFERDNLKQEDMESLQALGYL
ncbi:MAG: sulfatase-like hydrolase/transferase [Candidatus Hydrogenedentes bacterium]|nr:sulfatase-like hydrolase/transferase [Candidatus Hydrogenedentota bacterium]